MHIGPSFWDQVFFLFRISGERINNFCLIHCLTHPVKIFEKMKLRKLEPQGLKTSLQNKIKERNLERLKNLEEHLRPIPAYLEGEYRQYLKYIQGLRSGLKSKRIYRSEFHYSKLPDNISLNSHYFDEILARHKELLSSAASEKIDDTDSRVKNYSQRTGQAGSNLMEEEYSQSSKSGLVSSNKALEKVDAYSNSVGHSMDDFVHESPRREGLRRIKPSSKEKIMGINHSPSFGLAKKLQTDLEEDNLEEEPELENTHSMDCSPRGIKNFEIQGKPHSGKHNHNFVLAEEELDRRAF